jgi:hypothetical protein
MKLQDYKDAIFVHFNVASLKELRANQQWKAIAAQKTLPSLRTLQAWKEAYEAVFEYSEVHPNAYKSSSLQSEEELITSELRETAQFHVLEDNRGNLIGALLEYPPQQSQQLIEHFKNLQLHSSEPWHQGTLNSVVVDQLGASSTLVSAGLQIGKLFRVVGPPDLVGKMASGAYQMVQTSTGALGTVSKGGKIAGQLRFATGGAALPVLAPIVVYQILHAIAGTQQLNQINQRLAKIEHTLQELYVRQEAAVLGEIHYAVNTLDDIFASRMHTGVFSPATISRLALVEKTVVSMLERNRLLVERFRDKAIHVKNQSRKEGARSAAELLKSDGPQAIFDMQCLFGLIAADLKLEQAFLLLAMQENPADVGRRHKAIQSKMRSHHETIEKFPSVQEIECHAQACLAEMRWWERAFDFGRTNREVKAAKNLNLTDVCSQPDQLQPTLSGYIFWQDEEGTKVFSMSGDDLKLKVTESTE